MRPPQGAETGDVGHITHCAMRPPSGLGSPVHIMLAPWLHGRRGAAEQLCEPKPLCRKHFLTCYFQLLSHPEPGALLMGACSIWWPLGTTCLSTFKLEDGMGSCSCWWVQGGGVSKHTGCYTRCHTGGPHLSFHQ